MKQLLQIVEIFFTQFETIQSETFYFSAKQQNIVASKNKKGVSSKIHASVRMEIEVVHSKKSETFFFRCEHSCFI